MLAFTVRPKARERERVVERLRTIDDVSVLAA